MSLRLVKFIGYFIVIVLLTLFQVSFINVLPFPFNNFNLIITLLFFIVLIVSYQFGWWASLASGLFLEIYSPFIFGSILFPLLLSIIIINFLFKLLFTNRSFYSLLILGSIGLISYNLLNFTFIYLSYWLNLGWYKINWDTNYLINIAWQLLFTLIILFLFFLLVQLLTKRFKSVFLISGGR